MDSQLFAEEQALERPTIPPMFVAPSDEHEQPAADALYDADNVAGVERDWVIERMMDSYN